MNTMNNKRSQAAPLTAELAAIFRRLLAREDAALTAEGVFLRDPLLDVVGSVWPSENLEGHFDVSMSAFLPGGKRVPLDGLCVRAVGADEVGVVLRFSRTTARGDLALDALKEGLIYRLHSPAVWGRSEKPVPLPSSKRAYSADPPAPILNPWEWPVSESTDGKLRGLVQPQEDRTALVVFETNEAALAGADVHFALVQESGFVDCSGVVRLDQVREGLWEGKWSGSISLLAPCDLVFAVDTPAAPR